METTVPGSAAKAGIKNILITPLIHGAAALLQDHDLRRKWRKFRFYPRFSPIKSPVIFMTLLVKNEADIIEENLRFHRYMGVDGIIVTDNHSTDSTPEILKKYQREGLIKELIYDPDDNHDQVKKVDRMIRIAKEKYHADWIINADADEFFYTPSLDFHKTLGESCSNILMCSSHAMFSTQMDLESPVRDCTFCVRKTAPKKWIPQPFHICRITQKAVHRTDGYRLVAPGNHDVQMEIPAISDRDEIIIYHYIYRGYEHFRKKVLNGTFALRNQPSKTGNHWRYFAEVYQNHGEDALKQCYRDTLVLPNLPKLLDRRICSEDYTIADIMLNLPASR